MRTLLLTLALLPGCSIAFMETLPANHTPQQEPRCTSATGWAAWDMVIAGTNLAAGAVALTTAQKALSDYSEDDPRDADEIDDLKTQRNGALLLTGAALALYGTSAIYGLRQSSRCDDARAARDAYVRSASGGQRSR